MARPTTSRKSSAPWDRLRPARQDPLESMGFVSKGDSRLLDIKVQETYYQKIVTRYMQFCSRHSQSLDAAFASLSVEEYAPANSDPTKTALADRPAEIRQRAPQSSHDVNMILHASAPEDELSTILMSLRKLREGVLGSSQLAPSPVFSQRVHVFNIRVAILALHPASYHPSLSYLLFVLHTPDHPLPQSELVEMTTYAILDRALRQNDLVAAYALKHDSKRRFAYQNREVDAVLKAVVSSNWVAFWRVRRRVDGYVRAIMHWHVESIRLTTLKAFGRAYLTTNMSWLLQSATGSELSWDELVEKEKVGWLRDGDSIIIRKPKAK